MGRLERSVLSSPALEGQEREVVKPMNLIVVTDGGGSSALRRIRTVLTLSLCSSRHPTTPSPIV
jgi:hypothetical protein